MYGVGELFVTNKIMATTVEIFVAEDKKYVMTHTCQYHVINKSLPDSLKPF
jgi:hypothetical protein